MIVRQRLPLLAAAGISLLAGLWAGLVRLGWDLPSLLVSLPAGHGSLMISGFLGTLISLERAVALSHHQNGRPWFYAAPLLSGLGAVALLTTIPPVVGRGLTVLGASGLVLIFLVIIRMQPTTDHIVMSVGAGLWLAGNGLWLAQWPIHRVVPFWAGFLVLTIAGERLELSRVLLIKSTVRLAFLLIVGIILLGLLLSLANFTTGMRISGAGLLALGLWLLRFDISRRTIRSKGLTRFIAACLLPGYIWLVVGGVLWLLYGGQFTAGPIYDAMLHTIFVGFVISMIFGHAPVIFPAVLNIPIPYSPIFYTPLLLLHLSLLVRLIGDLCTWLPVRRWGGMLNEAAIVLFFVVTAVSTLRRKKPS